MKTTSGNIFICAALVGALTMSGLATQAIAQEASFNKLANLPFADGRPTKETAQTLRDELLFQRATQTYLWALQLINTLGMQVGSEKAFGAGYNVLPIWKQRLDAKTLVTTPNSDVLYAMSYVDLWVRATSRFRTATAARTFISGQKHRRGKKRTGSQRCRAKDTSPSSDSTGRPNPL